VAAQGSSRGSDSSLLHHQAGPVQETRSPAAVAKIDGGCYCCRKHLYVRHGANLSVLWIRVRQSLWDAIQRQSRHQRLALLISISCAASFGGGVGAFHLLQSGDFKTALGEPRLCREIRAVFARGKVSDVREPSAHPAEHGTLLMRESAACAH
jgi:hypothetical protein